MISKRLSAIAGKARGKSAADIGCDHGYTAMELLRTGRAERVFCMDVNEGPLSSCAENLKREGFSEKVSLLLSDGLRAAVLPAELLSKGEKRRAEAFSKTLSGNGFFDDGVFPEAALFCPDTLILSGMGGRLMTEILSLLPTNGACDSENGELLAKAAAFAGGIGRMVLSPQSEPELLRHFLIDTLSMEITDEEMLLDEGKFYLILTAEQPKEGNAAVRGRYRTEQDYLYGILLSEKKDPVFRLWIEREEEKLLKAIRAIEEKGSGAQSARRLSDLKRTYAEVKSYEA